MANTRRAKGAARGKSGKSGEAAQLRHAMFVLADAMAEQLRIATQLTFVLCMIDPRPTDESEAVVYQAMEIHDRLEAAEHIQRRIFRLAKAK